MTVLRPVVLAVLVSLLAAAPPLAALGEAAASPDLELLVYPAVYLLWKRRAHPEPGPAEAA